MRIATRGSWGPGGWAVGRSRAGGSSSRRSSATGRKQEQEGSGGRGAWEGERRGDQAGTRTMCKCFSNARHWSSPDCGCVPSHAIVEGRSSLGLRACQEVRVATWLQWSGSKLCVAHGTHDIPSSVRGKVRFCRLRLWWAYRSLGCNHCNHRTDSWGVDAEQHAE